MPKLIRLVFGALITKEGGVHSHPWEGRLSREGGLFKFLKIIGSHYTVVSHRSSCCAEILYFHSPSSFIAASATGIHLVLRRSVDLIRMENSRKLLLLLIPLFVLEENKTWIADAHKWSSDRMCIFHLVWTFVHHMQKLVCRSLGRVLSVKTVYWYSENSYHAVTCYICWNCYCTVFTKKHPLVFSFVTPSQINQFAQTFQHL